MMRQTASFHEMEGSGVWEANVTLKPKEEGSVTAGLSSRLYVPSFTSVQSVKHAVFSDQTPALHYIFISTHTFHFLSPMNLLFYTFILK